MAKSKSHYVNGVGTKVIFHKNDKEEWIAKIIYSNGKEKEISVNNKMAYVLRLKEQGYKKVIDLKNE